MTNLRILLFAILVFSSLFYTACVNEDDGIPATLTLPLLSSSDLPVNEGDVNSEETVVLTLTGENQTNAVVDFSSIAISANSSDYEIITKSPLIFKIGETSKEIKIKIIGDEVKESKETFQIKLYNPKNTKLEKDLFTITIKDDDDNSQGLIIPSSGYTTPKEYAGFSLSWEDEFDGDSLNAAYWTQELGDGCPNNCGWGNKELQYYRADNTILSKGNLIITAKKQSFGSRQYTSSRIVTKGKKFFKYGRIDIRAALPKGKGLWPALWMLGSNIDAVSWPSCGEIDIMELAGDLPNRVVGTVHFGSNTADHQYKGNSKYLPGNEDFNSSFHVFSLNWEADKIEFLVDDQIFYTVTPATVNGAAYPFNKNFFFIFNVAVGGNFPGDPDGTASFPQSMIVDYVRVFKKG